MKGLDKETENRRLKKSNIRKKKKNIKRKNSKCTINEIITSTLAKEIYLFKKKDGDEVSKKLWRSKELWKEVWESNKEEKIKKGCDISKKSRKQNTQTNKIIISTMKKKINLFEIGYGDEVNKKLRQSKSLCKETKKKKKYIWDIFIK